MAIVKQEQTTNFERLPRSAAFSAHVTLYTRSNFEEKPQDYLFYKVNRHKAVTVDKRTTVYFSPYDVVNLCTTERKESFPLKKAS